MNTGLMILVIALLLVAAIVLWALGTYNYFIRLRELLNEAWSGVDVQLKRRYDLIPNLIATVDGYKIHERGVLEDVTRLRVSSMAAVGVKEKAAAESGLSQTLKTLFAVVEQYPNLKANENFLALQKDLSLIEQELQLARRYYNGVARDYNSATRRFPAALVAGFFAFMPATYFELSSSKEKEAPRVKFDR